MQVHDLFHGLSGDVIFGRYATGETSIQIIAAAQVVAVATVNLEAWGVDPAADDEVWLKTWSENRGVTRALRAAGVVGQTVKIKWGGHGNSCRAVLAKLTPAALAERASQEAGR